MSENPRWRYYGMRPRLEITFIERVLWCWSLPGVPLALEDLGGSFNRNLRVRLAADDVVIRVRPPWARLERLKEIHQLLERLNREAVQTPAPRRSRSGNTCEVIEERLVEVYDFLPEQLNRDWTPERWSAAFAHMGRLHTTLGKLAPSVTPPQVCNYAPTRRLRLMLAATVGRLNGLPPNQDREEALAICQEAESVLSLMEAREQGVDLPQQVIHGDFHLDNLLFDEGANIRYTLDFDFVAARDRIFEIAYALRLALPELTRNPEGLLNSSMIREWLSVYDDHAAQPLTPQERESLPYEFARAALYFIADACHVDDPLAQVLRESAYVELACHLVHHPDSLL